MENAQLIGLSRQVALQRQMDVVANNMANINTAGFKNEAMLYEEYEMPVARDRDFSYSDQTLSYTQDWATMHDLSAGAIVQTGNPLDVALQGDGFLSVQTLAGERYTRDGSLKIDANGTLVTSNGQPVLAEGGPVTFGPAETDIAIGQDGSISSSAGNKGRLKVVSFEAPQLLKREGDNLFSAADAVAVADTSTLVMQGAIEHSNVSGVTEMANMIRVNRAYQTLSQMIERQDELRSKAIRTLGSMQA